MWSFFVSREETKECSAIHGCGFVRAAGHFELFFLLKKYTIMGENEFRAGSLR